MTETKIKSEWSVAIAALRLGVPTVEKLILHHIIVGYPILSTAALQANVESPKTTLGQNVKVKVDGTTFTLVDEVSKHRNLTVILNAVDINRGNKQIIHSIIQVLLSTLMSTFIDE